MTGQVPNQTDLHGILRALRRRRGVLVASLVLAPAAALGVSLAQEKQYTAVASLLFRDPGFDAKLFDSSALPASADPAREAETNLKLVSLDVVARRTARSLGGPLDKDDVSDKISVAAEGTSNVVRVEATDPSPRRAAQIADRFAGEYVAFRREADRSKVNEAARLVKRRLARLGPADRRGPRGASLARRAEELDVLASLQTGNAELVQRAEIPGAPSSPRTFLNVLLGMFGGVVLGTGLVFLLERLDRRFTDPREVADLFGRPILGVIPESRAFPGQEPGALPPVEAEAFRMLRANLRYFNVDRDVQSVVVTSAAPGDGKSTVAWHLASAAASTGTRVLLVEADLRHPVLSARADVSGPGLSQLLAGRCTLAEATHEVSLTTEDDDALGHRILNVVPAGAIPPNPTDLLESERMRAALEEAEAAYELVLIDTPPTSIVSDAIPLMTRVSGAIAVVRAGRTTRDAAGHLQKQFEHLGAPLLGVVVNALAVERRGYGAYGYADAYAPAESPAGSSMAVPGANNGAAAAERLPEIAEGGPEPEHEPRAWR